MKCKYCGSEILDTDIRCKNCNSLVEREVGIEDANSFYESTKKKSHNGILIFIIILLLGVIGGGYYYVTRPDVVFNTLVNNLFESANQELNKNYKQAKVDFDFTFDIDAGSEYKDITDLINSLNFKSSINTDLENKKIEFDLGVDYKNNALVDSNIYFDKNTIYIDLKNIFNKLIKYEIDENIEEINITEEDVNIILNDVFYALKDALKEGTYLSKTEKDINKYILVIDNENKNMMYNKFIDYLLNSNEFIDIMSKVSEVNKEDVINVLTESKEELDDIEEEIHISIYTKNLTNDFVKLEVGTKESVYITFNKIDDKTYKLETANIDDISTIVTITTDNNKTTLVYDINSEEVKAKATFNILYTYNEKINIPVTKESILITDLTEEDTNKMLENLMNNESVKEIIEKVTELMPQEDEELDETIEDDYEF